jgi:hypothetical protein
MGLLNMLLNQGSPLSIANGATPDINPLATQQSKLHYSNPNGGYSIDGTDASEVITAWNQYVDGVGNTVPQPSQLDLNGEIPGRYLDNPPE